jgi:Tfp pilus assembly protein PilF
VELPKRLNRFIILRIVGIICLSVAFGGCQTQNRTAEKAYQDGLRAQNQGDSPAAFRQFQRAVSQNPRHAKAWIASGKLLYQNHQYANAIKQLLKAVEYGGGSADLYAYLGHAYMQLGNNKLAEQFYQRALTYTADALDVRLHLADLLEAQGRWHETAAQISSALIEHPQVENEALLKARMALLRQPQKPDIYRALADLYISYGEIQKGLAAYQRFAPVDPQTPKTLAQFGIFCQERQQFKVAAEYLQKAVAAGVIDQPAVWAALGKTAEALGQNPEAIKAYRMTLQRQPQNQEIRLHCAALLEQAKQTTEAADVLEEGFYQGGVDDVNALWQRILALRGEDSKKAVVQLKPSEKFNLVDVVVNDSLTATMIIDTRAEYSIISEDLAQRLNILLSTQTSEVRFEFAGKAYKAPLINLPSLKIGKLEVRNVPTLMWDLSSYPGLDGVVGMTFLHHFQVEIKSHEQLVVLTKQFS